MRDDTVIVFIPSHDQAEKPLTDQFVWVRAGIELMSELYGGATAFVTHSGAWLDDSTNRLLWDCPIMLQSLADRADVTDFGKLTALRDFCLRLKREANQAAVLIIVNDRRHYL